MFRQRATGIGFYQFNVPPDVRADGSESVTRADIWNGFKEKTTAHGFPHMHHAKGAVKKGFWGLLVCGTLAMLLFHMWTVFSTYFSYKTNTAISLVSSRELDFPAITICNMSPVKKSSVGQSPTLAAFFAKDNRRRRRRKRSLDMTCSSPDQIDRESGFCFGLALDILDKQSDAYNYCKDLGQLAIINTASKAATIAQSAILDGASSNTFWTWVEQLKWYKQFPVVGFEQYAPGSPDLGIGDCVYIDHGNGGSWHSADCSDEDHLSVCQKLVQCPWPVYTEAGIDHCYFFPDPALTTTFKLSHDACKFVDDLRRYPLAALDSVAKYDHVINSGILQSAMADSFFVYLKRKGVWKWEEATETTYTRWEPGQPVQIENYVVRVNINTELWNTGDEDDDNFKAIALCEYTAPAGSIPYVAAFTTATTASADVTTTRLETTADLTTKGEPTTAKLTTTNLDTTADVAITSVDTTADVAITTVDTTADVAITSVVTTMDVAITSVDTTADVAITSVDTTADVAITTVDTTADVAITTVDTTADVAITSVDTTADVALTTVDTTADVAISSVDTTANVATTSVDTTVDVAITSVDTTVDVAITSVDTTADVAVSSIEITSQLSTTTSKTTADLDPTTMETSTPKQTLPATRPFTFDTSQAELTSRLMTSKPRDVTSSPTSSITSSSASWTTPAPDTLTSATSSANPGDKRTDFVKEETFTELLADIPSDMKQEMGYSYDEFLIDCQYEGRTCGINEFTSFFHEQYGNCYIFNSGWEIGKAVAKSSTPGRRYGLKAVVNIGQDEYIDTSGEEAGARVVISHQNTMPFPEDEGVLLKPGELTSIGVRQLSVHRKSWPYGDCLVATTDSISHNVYQELFNVSYTSKACYKTCYQKNIIDACNCADATYPSYGRAFDYKVVSACGSDNSKQTECKNMVQQKFLRNEYDCGCPNSCSETTYLPSISTVNWPSDNKEAYVIKKFQHLVPNLFSAPDDPYKYKRNLVKVEIYYEEFNYQAIEERPSYTEGQFMSDCGGILGLWVGFSVLTIFEFFELLLDYIVFGFMRLRRPIAPARNIHPEATRRPATAHDVALDPLGDSKRMMRKRKRPPTTKIAVRATDDDPEDYQYDMARGSEMSTSHASPPPPYYTSDIRF